MRAYYRNQTIRDHRRPGEHWYTVDGFALRFDSSSAAVRWIEATLETMAATRCQLSSVGRRTPGVTASPVSAPHSAGAGRPRRPVTGGRCGAPASRAPSR